MTQGQFFKQSWTGLNSGFSFSETSCLTKAEEPSLPYYLLIVGGRIIGFITFPKGISAMWNAISLVQDLNSCRRIHFLRHHGHFHKHNVHYLKLLNCQKKSTFKTRLKMMSPYKTYKNMIWYQINHKSWYAIEATNQSTQLIVITWSIKIKTLYIFALQLMTRILYIHLQKWRLINIKFKAKIFGGCS